MEFRVLGPVEVLDGGTVLGLGGPRHRALLAALLLQAGTVIAADRLIDIIWGEQPPRSAADMLHVRISELRKLLSASRADRTEIVITQPPGYLIRMADDELDARRFEHHVATGRRALIDGDPTAAAHHLRAALALWRGPAFGEIADRPYAQAEIGRLEDLRLQAYESRIDADLALGGHADLIGELRTLVTEHPLRERFWFQLIVALYRAGRQGEALYAYRSARQTLIEELGIEPGVELQQLQTAILRQGPVGTTRDRPAEHAALSNLPANLSSFIGREDDLAEVARLLTAGRLVTLTGAGGAGKSRLAIEIATATVAIYPGGAWLVELAPLTDPRLILPTVTKVLGLHEHPERDLLEVIVSRLRHAATLLILDNCEHLITHVADIVRGLLGACPQLRVLSTSRERLGITGEVVRPVRGLGLPDLAHAEAAQLRTADAIRLFEERAVAVRPEFDLSAAGDAVAEICRRLDGLPLAIELAAARIGAYSPGQIAAGLDDRFRLLTQGSRGALPQHQTLRAVVDWSYALLDEPERCVFEQLSVFGDGFTFDAAVAVCSDLPDGSFAGILARLVDQSLVTAEAGGGPEYRYNLLDTLRAYAAEGLQARGEQAAVRARHRAWFLGLAESARRGLRSADQREWLDRLQTEHGNLRAAIEGSLACGDREAAARLASSLYPFWDLRGHYSEGRRWLAKVLQVPTGMSAGTRSRAYTGLATLAVIQGDLDSAVAACAAAADLSRTARDGAGLAHALQYQAFIAIRVEDFTQADALLAESLEAARTAGATWEHGWSLVFLATLALARSDFAEAAQVSARAQATLRQVGDPEAIAWALAINGIADYGQGDLTRALENARGAFLTFDHLGGLWGLSVTMLFSGLILIAALQHAAGTQLLAASESLRESIGVGMLPFTVPWFEDAVSAARASLGPDAYAHAWATGATMPLDVARTETALRLREVTDGG